MLRTIPIECQLTPTEALNPRPLGPSASGRKVEKPGGLGPRLTIRLAQVVKPMATESPPLAIDRAGRGTASAAFRDHLDLRLQTPVRSKGMFRRMGLQAARAAASGRQSRIEGRW